MSKFSPRHLYHFAFPPAKYVIYKSSYLHSCQYLIFLLFVKNLCRHLSLAFHNKLSQLSLCHPLFIFFLKLLQNSSFTMLCQFLLYSKATHTHTHTHTYIYMYIYTHISFGFPSHLHHHRALSKVLCAVNQVLTCYLFYTQQCIYVNHNLQIHPTFPSPLVSIQLFARSVSLLNFQKYVQASAFRKIEYMYPSLSFPLTTGKSHQHYVQKNIRL